jgi:hypothetical protein
VYQADTDNVSVSQQTGCKQDQLRLSEKLMYTHTQKHGVVVLVTRIGQQEEVLQVLLVTVETGRNAVLAETWADQELLK